MRKLPLDIAFFLSLAATFFFPAFFPKLKIMPFSPLCVLALARLSPFGGLLLSTIAGLGIDLLSGSPFGVYAIAHFLTACALVRYKYLFFLTKPLSFVLNTALFSALVSLLLFIFFPFPLSFKRLLSEGIIMPLLDGVFGFCWFICPEFLYTKIKRIILNRFTKKGYRRNGYS